MRKFTYGLWIIFLLCCFLGNEKPLIAKEAHGVMVLVPRLQMEQFYQLMEKENLWEGAHVVALNRGTAAQRTITNEVLTISSGRKAKTDKEQWNWIITGKRSGEKEYMLVPFQVIKKENENTTHRAVLGSLGERLKRAEVHTSFTGHSDVFFERHYFAPFFTMNKEGKTFGNAQASVDKNEQAPGGYEMNGKKALQWLRDEQSKYPATWLVVEWGDFFRGHEEKMTESVEEEMIHRLASFLQQVRNENVSLFLLGVGPVSEKAMIPFVHWPAGSVATPVNFYSEMVQQPFLGSNMEVAPTIVNTYQLTPPKEWLGALRRGTINPTKERMERTLASVAHIYHHRAVILSTYIGILVALLIASFIHLQYMSREKRAIWLKLAVLAGMASPLVFVLVPFVFGRKMTSIPLYVAIVFVSSLLIGMFFYYTTRCFAVWGISFLLILLLSIDIFLDSPAMKQSYLGFDPLIGARYSGIGNELGGFFVAASIIVLEPFMRKKERMVAGIGLMICFLIILGAPTFGTNAGVTIAAGGMYLVWGLYMFQHESTPKYLLFVLLPLGVIMMIGLLWFMQQFGVTTHIGAFFQLIQDGNWQEVFAILQRKLEMNVKIMKYSRWTNLLLTSYVLIVLYILKGNHRHLSKGKETVLKAGTVGSVLLLAFNDSGAVAAATSMFYMLCARYVWTSQKT